MRLYLAVIFTMFLLTRFLLAQCVGPIWDNEGYFPKFKSPSAIEVIDVRGLPMDAKLAYISIQGIINRCNTSLYLVLNEWDAFWLEEIGKYVSVKYVQLPITELISRCNCSRAVIYDPEIPDTINVAMGLAALEDRVVMSPRLYEIYSAYFKDVIDLRELTRKEGWGNTPEARCRIYEWVHENLWPRAEKRIIAVIAPGIPGGVPITLGLYEYAVALRLTPIYLSAKDPCQRSLLEKFLAEAPSPGVLTAWFEFEEGETVSLATKYGKIVAVMGSEPILPGNLVIHSSMPVQPLKYTPPIRLWKILKTAEPGIYVTVFLTDGDNLGYDLTLGWGRYWQSVNKLARPIGFTINPILAELAPVVWNYYIKTKGPLVSLLGGAGGAGYFKPLYGDVNTIEQYLRRATRYWNITGILATQIIDGGLNSHRLYAAILRPLAVFEGYFPTSATFTYAYSSTMPSIYVTQSYTSNADADKIIEFLTQLPTALVFNAVSLPGFGSLTDGMRCGDKGAVIFGPYIMMRPGTYTVEYILETRGYCENPAAVVDVATDLGKNILTRKEVNCEERKATVRVTLTNYTDYLEFRVWGTGNEVCVKEIRVYNITNENMNRFYAISIVATASDIYRRPDIIGTLFEKLNEHGVEVLTPEEFAIALNPLEMTKIAREIGVEEEEIARAEALIRNAKYEEALGVLRKAILRKTARVIIVAPDGFTPETGVYRVPLGAVVEVKGPGSFEIYVNGKRYTSNSVRIVGDAVIEVRQIHTKTEYLVETATLHHTVTLYETITHTIVSPIYINHTITFVSTATATPITITKEITQSRNVFLLALATALLITLAFLVGRRGCTT